MSMSADPAAAATPSPMPAMPDGGPRLYGVVDVLRLDRVAGWAIDRTDPAASAEIEIRREGRIVATVRADRLRKDLANGGLGTGRYGFACTLEPPLEPGFEFTVTATARSADGVELELKRPGAGTRTADRDRRMLERIFADLAALRHAVAEASLAARRDATPESALLEAIRRLDVAQARIEAALSAIEPPPAPQLAGLRAVVGLSLATAIGSLLLGLWSLFG